MTTTAITGEPLISNMALTQKGGPPTEVASFRPDPNKASVTAYELWQLHKKKLQIRQEYLELWEATATKTGTGRPVDAIIAPSAPFAAPPHGANW